MAAILLCSAYLAEGTYDNGFVQGEMHMHVNLHVQTQTLYYGRYLDEGTYDNGSVHREMHMHVNLHVQTLYYGRMRFYAAFTLEHDLLRLPRLTNRS